MADGTNAETPEVVLQHILLRAAQIPAPSEGEAWNGAKAKQHRQEWFDGRLAEDFNHSDLFSISMQSEKISTVPSAVVINDDAYIYHDSTLFALVRDGDGLWRLRISLSMCWGCLGDHSISAGGCWGVLCNCCGGTGWEGGDLEFCAVDELSVDPALSIQAASPQEAFQHLVQARIPEIKAVERGSVRTISPALIRGDVAKLEVANPDTRFFALMRMQPGRGWYLSAFLPQCGLCGGRGSLSANNEAPCFECGGLKWGRRGQLRYCRNYVAGWWGMEHSNWLTIRSNDPRDLFIP
jgi:hypothetical protein